MGKPKRKGKNRPDKFDRFVLKYVPKLFEILGWAAILGVLKYISFKTEELGATVLYFASLIGFGIYLQAYLYNEVYHKAKEKKKPLQSFLLLLITAFFGIGTYLFLENIIEQLAVNN
jgi:hypothetical protein